MWGSAFEKAVAPAIRCSRTAQRLCLSRAPRLSIDTWTKCVCAYIFLSIRHPLTHDLGQAILQIPLRFRPAPASIIHERLVFTQSDMHISNFGVDDKVGTCLFDFGEVGLLPESFANYTMSLAAPFTVHVARHLVWPSSSNLESMSKIRRYLAILADPTLGTSICA